MSRKTNVMVSSTLRAVGVTTVMTSILWTTVGIYNALKRPVDLQISPAILAPITPAIEIPTINKLKERRQLSESAGSDEVIRQALAIMAIEPTEAERESPVEIPSATASASPEASEAALPEPTL